MSDTLWHDPKGNVMPLPGCDPSEPPMSPREAIQGEIIRAAWRVKQAADCELTPDAQQAITDDLDLMRDALGRFAGCGD